MKRPIVFVLLATVFAFDAYALVRYLRRPQTKMFKYTSTNGYHGVNVAADAREPNASVARFWWDRSTRKVYMRDMFGLVDGRETIDEIGHVARDGSLHIDKSLPLATCRTASGLCSVIASNYMESAMDITLEAIAADPHIPSLQVDFASTHKTAPSVRCVRYGHEKDGDLPMKVSTTGFEIPNQKWNGYVVIGCGPSRASP
jgi:hypothetical protein